MEIHLGNSFVTSSNSELNKSFKLSSGEILEGVDANDSRLNKTMVENQLKSNPQFRDKFN